MEKRPETERLVLPLYRGWKVEFSGRAPKSARIERRREHRPVDRDRRRGA
jgi:hypothetical protein